MKHALMLSAAAIVLAATGLLSFAGASPPASGTRLTKFEAGTLRAVIAGAGPVKSTNYVLDYSITNESKAARKPGLRLEVRTRDTKKSHADVFDASAFKAAAKDMGMREAPASTNSLRGTEQAAGAKASGLANFGSIDPNSDSFEVRVYGLYDPVYRDHHGKVWSENRVLVLEYARTGDEFDRHLDPLTLAGTTVEVEGDRKAVHESK